MWLTQQSEIKKSRVLQKIKQQRRSGVTSGPDVRWPGEFERLQSVVTDVSPNI